MSTTDRSTEQEIEGSVVFIVHCDESGTDPVRTILALTDEDALSLSVDEDETSFNPAGNRSTQRYRTNHTVDLEAGSLIDVDFQALELVGLVDSSTGEMTFDTASRKIDSSNSMYLEVGYATLDDDNITASDFDLVHRFHDAELSSPEIDISSTPPVVSWTWMIHGDIIFDYQV